MKPLIRTLRTKKAQRLATLLLSSGALAATAQGQALVWSGTTDANFNTGTANWSGGTLSTSSILTFGTSSAGYALVNNAAFTSYAGLDFTSNALAYTINSTSTAVTLAGNITQNAANTQTWNGGVTWTGTARTLNVVSSSGVMAFGNTGSTLSHVINGGVGTNKATMTGAGEVRFLSNTSGSLVIASTVNGDVDMSGLAKFTVQTGTMSIASGGAGGVTSTGTISLAGTSSITATILKIGDTLGGSLLNNPIVRMGASTTINADTINIGSTRSRGTLNFLATSGSTVTIRGTAGGTSKANITLGYYQTSPGSYNPAGTMNFTGGSVDARIDEMILGRNASAGGVTTASNTAQGTFTMPAGTVIADTVRLGYWSGGNTGGTGTNNTALGTLNISGGTFTVNTELRAGDAAVSGTHTVARGVVNVSGGTLDVSGSFLLGILAGSGAASNQRGTLNITGTGLVNSNVAILSSGGQSTLTLNGGTLDMKGNEIGSATASQQIGLNGGALNFQSGTLQNLNGINGSAGLTKTTTGTLSLLGTMAYTGATTVTNGTLRLGNGGTTGSLGNAGQDVTLSSAADSVLEINRSDSASIDNKITGAGKVTVSGGVITLSNELNDYTGATKLAGGTLSIADIDNGNSASALGMSTNDAANLVFDGGTLKYTGADASTDRNFNITNAKTAKFDITNELTLTGGANGGTGAIEKLGAGTLVVAGGNTNSGVTTITGGTLKIVDGGSLGIGGIENSGKLAIDRSAALSLTNDISGAGAIEIVAGETTFGGDNTFTGVTTLKGGSLSVASIGAGGNLGSAGNAAANLVFDGGALKYTGGTTSTAREFTINNLKTAFIDVSVGATELTMSGNSGASTGGLTKQGLGTLILTGSHAYTGNTLVAGGTLRLGVGGSLSGSSIVTVSSSAFFDAGATPLEIAGGQEYKVNGGITGNLDISDGGILSGSGTVTGDVTFGLGGIHSVGNSPGLQNIIGNDTYNSGSYFYWDLTVPTDPSANFSAEVQTGYGTQWDAVDISGNLLGEAGAIFRVVLDTGDFTNDFWLEGRRWNSVFTAANINTVDLNTIFTSFEFYRGGSLIDAPVGGGFTFENGDLVFAIPEPSSALFGLLIGAGLLRRRRAA